MIPAEKLELITKVLLAMEATEEEVRAILSMEVLKPRGRLPWTTAVQP